MILLMINVNVNVNVNAIDSKYVVPAFALSTEKQLGSWSFSTCINSCFCNQGHIPLVIPCIVRFSAINTFFGK